MKTCFKCKTEKPFSAFYKHAQMGDGYLGKCKECTKSYVAEHREKNLDRIREYDRSRANNPNRIAARKAYAATEEGKASASAAKTRYIQRNAEKRKAHDKLGNAVRDGKVSPLPCFVCGEKAEAHHSSYDFPLGVTWLCDKHHKETHKMHRAIERERNKLAA